MLRRVKAWLNARRFHRLFVEPYEARKDALRRRHGVGVRALQAEQRDRLHAALRGRA